jgi:S1-C subfamily serine protease
VAEAARPAVVQITSQRAALDQRGRPTTGNGVGSGVIYDPRCLILTNNHVVEGARSSLVVSLPDGRAYPGTLLSGDSQMDLAVVKIEAQAGEALPVATLGDSNALGVGDGVVAIGNALALPGGPTVTAGVVSALWRAIQEPSDTPTAPGPYLYDLIQTDAAINPGNSGGPLLDMAGEVVGINTLGAGGDGSTMTEGIGFAIAINTARPVADQLAAGKPVAHPFLGIGYGLLTPALASRLNLPVKQGVLVSQVAPGSPAAQAGLQARDVIVAVDGQSIVDETTLGRALNQHQPGDRVSLSVARGSGQQTLDVTLGQRPGQ